MTSLASAIQTEVEIVVDRDPNTAQPSTEIHWSQLILAKYDYRYPFEDRITMGDEYTSKMVDKIQKDEISKIDSASLHPFTTNIKIMRMSSAV